MLILASKSVTRQTLLAGAGVRFSTCSADIDERKIENQAQADGADAGEIATRLAVEKARFVSLTAPGAWVIGADQTLALDSELLHKPADMDAARTRLDRLCAKTHRLHAGLALVRDGQIIWHHVDTATLTMRRFDAAERDLVLALEGDAVLSSVGGYRLEGPSIRLFQSIAGDYFTILGLPLLPLLAVLRIHAPHILTGDDTA